MTDKIPKKRGAPKADETRKLFSVRLLDGELAAISDAAKREGLSVSAYIRWSALHAAKAPH